MGITDSTAASKAYVTRLRPRGQLTIPQPVRDALSLAQGDIINLIQVGDLILLMPRQPRTPALAEQFIALMEEEGVTLAELLAGLAEEREALWRERQERAQ